VLITNYPTNETIADIDPFVRTSICRMSSQYIVSRQGTADAFERKLPNWFDCDSILDGHQDPGTNQDLTGLRFVAKPRCDVGHGPDGGVVEASLEANGT
jgi:hypothetical protein